MAESTIEAILNGEASELALADTLDRLYAIARTINTLIGCTGPECEPGETLFSAAGFDALWLMETAQELEFFLGKLQRGERQRPATAIDFAFPFQELAHAMAILKPPKGEASERLKREALANIASIKERAAKSLAALSLEQAHAEATSLLAEIIQDMDHLDTELRGVAI